MSDKINFRFMSGEHIGSSLRLSPGRYTIGGTSDCDICLNDAELATASFILEIDESLQVSVESHSLVLKIDGESIEGRAVLDSGRLLSFGLASLMYVTEGEQFMPAAMDKIIGHSARDNEKKETLAEEVKDTVSDSAPADKSASYALADTHQERRFFIFNIAGVILLSLILVTLIAGSYLFESRSSYQRDLNAVISYIKDSGHNDLTATLDKDSIIVINGMLADEIDLKYFLQNLPETSCSTRLDIDLANKDVKAIERSFLLHGYYVRAEQVEDKVFKIYGYARDAYTVYPVFAKARKEFASFSFENALTYEGAMHNLIQKNDAALASALSIRPQSSFIVYEDRISQSEAAALDKLKSSIENSIRAPVHFMSYKDASRGAIEVYDRVKKATVSKPESKKTVIVSDTKSDPVDNFSTLEIAPEDVIGVTLKPMKFITLKNGIKYFEGALMPGGYVLKSIAIDKLIFEKEGDSIEYALK